MRKRAKLDKMFDLLGVLVGTLLFHLGWILLVGMIMGVIQSGTADFVHVIAHIILGLCLTVCIVFD